MDDDHRLRLSWAQNYAFTPPPSDTAFKIFTHCKAKLRYGRPSYLQHNYLTRRDGGRL